MPRMQLLSRLRVWQWGMGWLEAGGQRWCQLRDGECRARGILAGKDTGHHKHTEPEMPTWDPGHPQPTG